MQQIILLKRVSKHGGKKLNKQIIEYLFLHIIPSIYHIDLYQIENEDLKKAKFACQNKEYLINIIISTHHLIKVRRIANMNVWGMTNSIYHHDYKSEIKELVENISNNIFLILRNLRLIINPLVDPQSIVGDEIYSKEIAIKLINNFIK